MRPRLHSASACDARAETAASNSNSCARPKRRSGADNWIATRDGGGGITHNHKGPLRRPSGYGRQRKHSTPCESSCPLVQSSAAGNRRSTVQFANRILPPDSPYAAAKEKELKILDQLKHLCRDYIHFKLRQNKLTCGFSMQRLYGRREGSQQFSEREQRHYLPRDRWLFHDIILIFRSLEGRYRTTFQNIARQIGITLRSDDVVRKILFQLFVEILTTDDNEATNANANDNNSNSKSGLKRIDESSSPQQLEITWGRICAIVVVAGNLAVDCVKQDHLELVNRVVDSCGEFAANEGVLRWILARGGWEALGERARVSPAPSHDRADLCRFATACNVAFGLVACCFVVAVVVFATAACFHQWKTVAS